MLSVSFCSCPRPRVFSGCVGSLSHLFESAEVYVAWLRKTGMESYVALPRSQSRVGCMPSSALDSFLSLASHTVNPQGLPSLSTCLNSSLLGSMSHCRIPVFPAAHHTSESDTLCGGDLDPHTLLSSCVTDNPTPATFFLALKFSPPCAIFSVYSS